MKTLTLYEGNLFSGMEIIMVKNLCWHGLSRSLIPSLLSDSSITLINKSGCIPITASVLPPTYSDVYKRQGENGFINYNCTILDTARIYLGKNILIGPNVQLYAPMHPIDYRERATVTEHGEPITCLLYTSRCV